MSNSVAIFAIAEPVAKKTTTVGRSITFSYNIKAPARYKNNIKEIYMEITDDIVKPIVTGDIDNLRVRFDEALRKFELHLIELNNELIRDFANDPNLVFNTIRQEVSLYEIVKAFSLIRTDIYPDQVTKLVDILSNVEDYENMMLGLVLKRSGGLKDALKSINLADLSKNVSGGFLSLFCILTLIDGKPDNDKLSILLKLGKEFTEEMITYADTIDTLTNQEAMSAIGKSE